MAVTFDPKMLAANFGMTIEEAQQLIETPEAVEFCNTINRCMPSLFALAGETLKKKRPRRVRTKQRGN